MKALMMRDSDVSALRQAVSGNNRADKERRHKSHAGG